MEQLWDPVVSSSKILVNTSTVLFGSADKLTGICSEEKTRTLVW